MSPGKAVAVIVAMLLLGLLIGIGVFAALRGTDAVREALLGQAVEIVVEAPEASGVV